MARFAAVVLVFALAPASIGLQDLGALLASQPAVAQRARIHLIASPFGTIHAATFSMPRPIGTRMPHPPLYALANFDPLDLTGTIGAQPLGDAEGILRFPSVDRSNKRDSMISRARDPMPPLPDIAPVVPDEAKDDTARFNRYAEYEFTPSPDQRSHTPDVDLPYTDMPPTQLVPMARPDGGKDTARIFFGVAPMTPERDSDIKQSALDPLDNAIAARPGESTAPKGQVTGPDQRPKSPAERLALSGAARARAEKCLANAVYFEARGEEVRGQIAVAQVVMNRVFSRFYPNNVCDVVYQNAHRHLACQFTFACDGIPDVVTEPDAWERAKRIAADTLDGKLWMPEVAKSTHYHASWVRPSWIGEMRRILKLGVHTFYRPRNWGDGADEPHWGDARTTELEAKKL